MDEFKEPPKNLEGKFRWQVIKILSEGGSEGGRRSELRDRDGRIVLDSRDSSATPDSKGVAREVAGDSPSTAGGPEERGNDTPTKGAGPSSVSRQMKGRAQEDETLVEYERGVYLAPDASLKDLRNQFLESGQLEEQDGTHFQFLRSDVPGDRIEVDTEDETLLCQIEDSLVQKRTMYIESIDPCKYHVMSKVSA